ncbi:MAG: hypothetical protein M3O61_17720, partial [Gemmatimonadota bacterium]|nr:hypothetical protein [Gemmatimonadota bacterium]
MKFRSLAAAMLVLSAFGARAGWTQTRTIAPVLAFPERGLDHPASYQGYQTRFFRDAMGNVVQIYLDTKSGRVVNLLADAANESVGFTVRDGGGKPIRLEFASQTATISTAPHWTLEQPGRHRTIEYTLVANAPRVEIGWILLGSMRVERDLQYSGRHLQPYATPTFRLPEQEELIENLAQLPSAERDRHFRMLRVRDVSMLRARLHPVIVARGATMRSSPGARVSQTALDGQTRLELDLSVDPSNATLTVAGPVVSIHATRGAPIRFTVQVSTDAPSLTPLSRTEIFNPEFLRFLAKARADAYPVSGSAVLTPSIGAVERYRRLEREALMVETLSSREKLMAGLPNYATYFGRDMMMTALMMEPIWSNAMSEHVIASVLRKLGPAGDVSHEEALGGQAIRENSVEYNAHVKEHLRLARGGQTAAADTALANARALLVNLQKVRENYHMLDDEFQLPLLAARYLANPAVSSARKRAFLMDSSDGRGPRVLLLLRELALVSKLAAPYGREPAVLNLVGSPRIDSTRWRSVSWRDSGVGYANGRFAMDINAIWVPRALESISGILTAFRGLGFSESQRTRMNGAIAGTALADIISDPARLQRAIENWNGASRHFVVSLAASDIGPAVQRKLQSLPAEERTHWQRVLASSGADRRPLEFLALSLDSAGRPIPVVNSDPATWLLLRDRRDMSAAARDRATRDVRAFMRAYPVGLFVDRLGPLVANDAHASPSVWEAFEKDRYHSPRVVWGREVNLFMLGLASEINASVDRSGRPRDGARAAYVNELREALRRTSEAVEASGLKHTELWSYEIAGGRLNPIRYGAATDIQLWNVTDLAVQFVLSQLR